MSGGTAGHSDQGNLASSLFQFCAASDNVHQAVHLCCGYPDRLDTDEYLKAPKTNYNLLAPKLDSLGFDEVSIEDAEANNDLSLLALFKNTKVGTKSFRRMESVLTNPNGNFSALNDNDEYSIIKGRF